VRARYALHDRAHDLALELIAERLLRLDAERLGHFIDAVPIVTSDEKELFLKASGEGVRTHGISVGAHWDRLTETPLEKVPKQSFFVGNAAVYQMFSVALAEEMSDKCTLSDIWAWAG
jgi:hypothetical protein